MIEISVPPHEDSVSGITLNNERFEIRFTYNFECDYWTYGINTATGDIIYQGIKIVPNYILNPVGAFQGVPDGLFFCGSNRQRIGRNDFLNGRAQFLFLTADEFADLV